MTQHSISGKLTLVFISASSSPFSLIKNIGSYAIDSSNFEKPGHTFDVINQMVDNRRAEDSHPRLPRLRLQALWARGVEEDNNAWKQMRTFFFLESPESKGHHWLSCNPLMRCVYASICSSGFIDWLPLSIAA